ncbi:unnamed protein product [Linum trigynum]|uniref:Uncharacterized protein n=1 Tax=Linum trigynum TaxID=586398 RepID=A0AAV2GBH3_9ROSI
MPLILGRPFLATAKTLIDVNERTLILRYGEERITLGIDHKPRSEEVKEVEPSDMNASGGKPYKANPTIAVSSCDGVKQESNEGISPKEGRKKVAWRKRISRVNARRKEKGKAKVIGQEGHQMELKLGGTMRRPKNVADPLSVASCSKT